MITTAPRGATLKNVTCPTPRPDQDRVQLGHGSGGKMSARLLRERFLPRFGNKYLAGLGDGSLQADVARLSGRASELRTWPRPVRRRCS